MHTAYALFTVLVCGHGVQVMSETPVSGHTFADRETAEAYADLYFNFPAGSMIVSCAPVLVDASGIIRGHDYATALAEVS